MSRRLRAVQPQHHFLIKSEVAAKLRCSVRSIDNYMAKATDPIPFHKKFGRVLFDEAEVEAWAKSDRMGAA